MVCHLLPFAKVGQYSILLFNTFDKCNSDDDFGY